MKKNWYIRPPLDQEQKRIGIPGLMWRENEEEVVYQTSSRGLTQKNCSTKPGSILLNLKMKKNWPIKHFVQEEEELV